MQGLIAHNSDGAGSGIQGQIQDLVRQSKAPRLFSSLRAPGPTAAQNQRSLRPHRCKVLSEPPGFQTPTARVLVSQPRDQHPQPMLGAEAVSARSPSNPPIHAGKLIFGGEGRKPAPLVAPAPCQSHGRSRGSRL